MDLPLVKIFGEEPVDMGLLSGLVQIIKSDESVLVLERLFERRARIPFVWICVDEMVPVYFIGKKMVKSK